MLLLLLRKQRETNCECFCTFALTLTLNAPGSHPGNKDFSIFFVASWVCFGCLYFEFSLRVRSMMASYLHHDRVTAMSLAHGVVIMGICMGLRMHLARW